MTKWTDYAQVQTDSDAAHFAMLASQLTYTITQTRLREAAMEEATDQVAYLEERAATLASLVDLRTRDVQSLTAAVEQQRVRAVTDDLNTMLSVLTTLIGMLERLGAQASPCTDDLATAAMLAERVQQYANTLPKEQWRLHSAANEVTMHVRTLQERNRCPTTPRAENRPDGRR